MTQTLNIIFICLLISALLSALKIKSIIAKHRSRIDRLLILVRFAADFTERAIEYSKDAAITPEEWAKLSEMIQKVRAELAKEAEVK